MKRCWPNIEVLAIGGLSVLGSGCLIEPKRCDAHQVEVGGDYALCVCEPNAVFNDNGSGCTPCGENEQPQNEICTCKPGFARLSADAGCVASQVGTSCSAQSPCGEDYPYCAVTSGSTNGYCTSSGCTRNADCAAGWTCETDTANGSKYCRRPVSGMGLPCESSADCAGFEADYCEQLVTHACILNGCAARAVTCPNEWSCCDFSALIPLSVCVPPEMLAMTDGVCPRGGVLFEP